MIQRRAGSVAVLAVALSLAGTAYGDGLHLLVSQPAGPFVVSIFTSPTPLRVGAAEISVMVQSGDDRRPITDAAVQLLLRAADGPGAERSATATRGTVANKMVYAAQIDLPSAGRWTLTTGVSAGGRTARLASALDVQPALAPLLAFWGFIALPFVVIALFLLHQWLKHARRAA